MAMQTPWGPAQTQTNIARGIIEVTTAGHGGIRVSPTLNARVHEVWRERDGWYEEDCDWAKVALTFPQHFDEKMVQDAHECAKRWYPAQYAKVMGVPVAEIVSVGTCPRCGTRVERPGGQESTRCAEEGCDTPVELCDEERIHQPDGKTAAATRPARAASGSPYPGKDVGGGAARCDHQTEELGCELRTCWGVPPRHTVFSGWRAIPAEETPGEPGVYSVGRTIVETVRRLLPGHTVTHAMYGETAWDRDKAVRQVCAFRFVVDDREVTVVAYQSRSALVADPHGYLAVWVDGDLVAAGIRQNVQPSTYGRQVALAIADQITQARAVPEQPRIADVVRIQYAYLSARDGGRVDITDEAGARALVERFGHALGVQSAGDGMSLLVATSASRGQAGSSRLHAMAADAGLLPAIVSKAEWEKARVVEAAAGRGDAEARIRRLLPYFEHGAQFNRSVSMAVNCARAKLDRGEDPDFDLVRAEAWAGLRPRQHIALAMRGQPVPPVADQLGTAAKPVSARVRGRWAALISA